MSAESGESIGADAQEMRPLDLHPLHQQAGAHFGPLTGQEIVQDYGDPLAEHRALRETAGLIDLGFRGRLSVSGADSVRFINGQVSNNVKSLLSGEGCYAALVTAKGKLQSDLNIYRLPAELLLDFEPGLSAMVTARLEQYIIADDVQISDVSNRYGLLSVQGPAAAQVVTQLDLKIALPETPMRFLSGSLADQGELLLMNLPRTGTVGFDLFIPKSALAAVFERLLTAVSVVSGRLIGWQSFEMARIEAGTPRFGVDMDESNLAPEAGIEARAISYTKGCYIGQEIIARLRSRGQVAKTLCGFRLADGLKDLPKKSSALFLVGKEMGYITSALASPALRANIALGYVRREANQLGTVLSLGTDSDASPVQIVPLPFR